MGTYFRILLLFTLLVSMMIGPVFADTLPDQSITSQVTFQGLLLDYEQRTGGGHLTVEITDIIDDPEHILNIGDNVTISYMTGLPPPYQQHFTIDPTITMGGFVEVFCTATDSTLTLRDGNYVLALSSSTITASAGDGGSISPSGPVRVPEGGSQTFTITPDSGYVIQDVLVDNVSRGAVSSYTFTDVEADHTITAVFLVVTEKGTLWVASYPQGATILIDGVVRGQTDQFVGNVPAGIRNLTLTKGGYQAKTLVVKVPVNALKVLPPVTLQPDGESSGTGTLYIASFPSGATIYIDGITYGQTNGFTYHVPTGIRNLTLTRAGYQAKTMFVHVPAGELKVLAPISLERA